MVKKIIVPVEVMNLQEEGFHLFVKAKLGKHKMRLLIDTGASKTLIDRQFILRHEPGLPLHLNEQPTTGVGTNTIQSEFASIEMLKLGKLKLKNYKVAVLDLQHVNETYELIQLPPINGVLGCDVLVEYYAVIKLDKHELVLKTYN